MPTVNVALSAAMQAQLAITGSGTHVSGGTNPNGVTAWAVFFDSAGNNPTWTQLTGATTPVTITGAGQKLYFILQSTDSLPNAGNSVQALITKESQIVPTGISTSAQTLNYRYDSFEVSFTPAPADAGNLTDINGFGIPMAIEVVYSNGTSATRGYGISGGTVGGGGIWNEVASAGGSGSIQYFSAISSGGYSSSQARMAISPATAIGNGVSGTNYSVAQWNPYVSSLLPGGSGSTATTSGNANQIQLAGYYNGGNDANNIWHNGGFYAYDVTASGTNFILTANSSSQIQGTITLTAADLANSIYLTQGNATVSGFGNGYGTANTSTLTMNTGYNNAWGAVLRDFIAGFTAGYWNTSATSVNSAVSGSLNLNKEWNQDPTYAFGGSITSGSGSVTRVVTPMSAGSAALVYDEYAKVFFDHTNSYGNGYSDFLTRAFNVGPLINVSDGTGSAVDSNNITVSLFADTDSATGYTSQTINNYLAPGGGGYLVPAGVNTTGVKTQLNFNVGTMSLASGTPITIVLKGATSASDVALPTISSFGNYTVTSGSGGYVMSNTGAANNGFVNIDNLPVTAAASGTTGVNWYQIIVGSSGSTAQKTFNLYETVNDAGQILNPSYAGSGSAGSGAVPNAISIDGLATAVGNGSASQQYIANTTGQVTINFQAGGTDTLNPALMAIVPLSPAAASSTVPTGGYVQPWATVIGWRPGYTSSSQIAFREMYDVWNVQSSVASSVIVGSNVVSWTGAATSAVTVYNGGLVFGWDGADAIAAQQQAGLSSANYYLNHYTNKIGGGNVAKLTFTALSGGALPVSGLTSGSYLAVTADSEGTWQTGVPVQFANGAYTVTMQEFLATDSAFASALNSASVVQSFTVSQGAVISTYNLSVDSGQTSAGLILESGGAATVAGGTTSALLVSSGGTAYVASGSDSGDFILGGVHQIWAGAAASGMTIYSGGIGQVYGSSYFATLSAGAFQYVGGVATSALAMSTTVNSGASLYVLSGGRTGSAYLSSGSTAYSGAAIVSGGAIQVVLSGGTALGTTLGGTQYVSGGGTASGTTVQSGALQLVGGGGAMASALNTSVGSGGTLTVTVSGTAMSGFISGGTLHTHLGGVTSQANLLSGAVQKVWSSGSAVSTTVQSGTSLYVYSGGYAAAPTVQSGGALSIWGGGTSASGGSVTGASEYLYSGAVHSGMTVNAAGNMYVHLAGSAIGTTLGSGGYLRTWGSGSLASNTTVVTSGAYEYVYSGATESGSTVGSGGQIAVWGLGSLAAGTTVIGGGNEYVYSGATASGVTVNASGTLTAWDSGTTVNGTNVNSGGLLHIHGGAAVGDTNVIGTLFINNGGAVEAGTSASFVGANSGTVKFTHDVTGVTVSGLVVSGGAIDFADIAYGSGLVTSWSSTGVNTGTLTLTSGALNAAVTLFGAFTAASDFTFGTDGAGGTLVRDLHSGSDFLSPPGG